jgi:hypothetical protein
MSNAFDRIFLLDHLFSQVTLAAKVLIQHGYLDFRDQQLMRGDSKDNRLQPKRVSRMWG